MRFICVLYALFMRCLCVLYAFYMRCLCVVYAFYMRFICVLYAVFMRCLCVQCDYAIFILTYYCVELVIHVLVSTYHVLFSFVFNFV